MANELYMDGFETYAVVADLDQRYTRSGGTLSATGGRGNTAYWSATNSSSLARVIPTTSVLSMLVAFKWNGSGSVANWWWLVSGSQPAGYASISAAGIFSLTVPNLGTFNFGQAVVSGVWSTFEVQWKIDSVAGYVKARVNGVEFCNVAGNTKYSTVATTSAVYITGPGATAGGGLDDFIIATSGAPSLAYIGDKHVGPMKVNGAGDLAMLAKGGTSPAATNWQGVMTQDGDTTFNYSATPSDRDLFTIEDPLVASDLFAVQVTAVVRKDDAANRVARTLIKSGGTEYEGNDYGAALGYGAASYSYLTNPATGAAWTSATRPQIGYKVQS